MKPELQKYYEDSFETFATPGWKALMEDLQKVRDQANNLSAASDGNNLWFRKGQLDILDLILTRKESTEHYYKLLQEDDSAV